MVEKTHLVPGENRPYRENDLIKTTLYRGFFNKEKEGKKPVTCENRPCSENDAIESDAVERFYCISSIY